MFLMESSRRSCLILDGGLGTTVEEIHTSATRHPLWSGKLLNDDPQLLAKTHLQFLEAGADIVETATYQLSLEAFARAGYTEPVAHASMLSAITLAEESIRLSEQSSQKGSTHLIALSLGPYGAQITQEYSGIYPPPYGPTGTFRDRTPSFMSQDENRSAELALADWHYERLALFAQSPQHWSKVGIIAFETIPLLREGRAICRSMKKLKTLLDTRKMVCPGWWISFVFPGGQFPQEVTSGGPRILPQEIARQIFEPGNGGEEELAVPDGIGVNCTKLQYISSIIRGYATGIEQLPESVRPTLIIYPDGGLEYDVVNKRWPPRPVQPSQDAKDNGQEVELWGHVVASKIDEAVHMTDAEGCAVWPGIIVGGCCKTGPDHIRSLKNACKLVL